MRIVAGDVVLPARVPARAAQVVIEVRDVSLADAPSRVVAEQRLEQVALEPRGRLRFRLRVPEVEPTRTLSLRVHVDVSGGGRVLPGDLLTTAACELPCEGAIEGVDVPVVVV